MRRRNISQYSTVPRNDELPMFTGRERMYGPLVDRNYLHRCLAG